MSWLRYFRRTRKDQDLAEEIQSYLQITIDENIAAGMTRTKPPPQPAANSETQRLSGREYAI